MQIVFQPDKAAYSLETGQHQWIHKNANGFLGRANTGCVQGLRGDRVNFCWTTLPSVLSSPRGQTAWWLQWDFMSNKETHLHLLGCKTSPQWRGSRSMPHYPRKRTRQRSDSWARKFITSIAEGIESREKGTSGRKQVMLPKKINLTNTWLQDGPAYTP